MTCGFRLQWKWRILSEFNTFLKRKQLYHYSARGLTSTVVKRTCHSIYGWFVKIRRESLLQMSNNLVKFIIKETVCSSDSVPWDCTHVVRKPCIYRVIFIIKETVCSSDSVPWDCTHVVRKPCIYRVIFIIKETVYSCASVPWDCTHVVRKPCINRVVGSTLVEGRICNLDKVECYRFENFQDFKTVFCKNFLLLNSAIF